jgi:hypothetical protein
MAARLRKSHQDDVRAKIQASQLINVLQNHALGNLEELSPSRLKAIEILLRKTVPDLTAMQLSGDGGGPIIHKIEYEIVDPSGSGTTEA